jgi:predicted nucleotidyltransferase
MAAPLCVTVFAKAKTRASRGLPLPLVTDVLVRHILLGCVRPSYVGRNSKKDVNEMKDIENIQSKQKDFIENLKIKINDYVSNNLQNIPELYSVLLSGSVSRGTYMPDHMGGAIDLTLIVDNKKSFNKQKYLGDKTEDIPEYFIKNNEMNYQFVFYDRSMLTNFANLNESKKYALFESTILLDKGNYYQNKYKKELVSIKDVEIKEKYKNSLGYINYLLNDYKINRWINRSGFIQLHMNLNKAIDIFIKCLFHCNGSYAPAEDRSLYFSFGLKKIPIDYKKYIDEVAKVLDYTLEDYKRREEVFKNKLLSFVSDF